MFNYDLVKTENERYRLIRLGIPYDATLAEFDGTMDNASVVRLLQLETQDAWQNSRNEALLDIRRIFLGDARLGIDVSALPHIAKASDAKEVAVTIALQEMTEALKELAKLREIVGKLRRQGIEVDDDTEVNPFALVAFFGLVAWIYANQPPRASRARVPNAPKPPEPTTQHVPYKWVTSGSRLVTPENN